MRIKLALVVIALIAFTALGISSIVNRDNKLKLQKVELQDSSTKLKLLEAQYQQLNTDLDTKSKTLEQVQKEREELQKQKDELAKQVSAKQEAQRLAAQKVQTAATRATGTAVASAAPISGCGDNSLAHFIYTKESGCRLGARNPIGCIGIGQNCPDKNGFYWLKAACPDWETNYSCQNQAFTNYAVSRYGSWSGAHAFWLQNHWW